MKCKGKCVEKFSRMQCNFFMLSQESDTLNREHDLYVITMEHEHNIKTKFPPPCAGWDRLPGGQGPHPPGGRGDDRLQVRGGAGARSNGMVQKLNHHTVAMSSYPGGSQNTFGQQRQDTGDRNIVDIKN